MIKKFFSLTLSALTCLVFGQQALSRGQAHSIIAGTGPGFALDFQDGISDMNIAGSFTTGTSLGSSGNNSSSFAGWGTPVGVIARPFNYFDVVISTWDRANIPTLARGRVYPTFTVTGATNTSPIVVNYTPFTGTTSTIMSGDTVRISNVVGNTASNGTYTITVVDSTHFSLNGAIGNGTYSSGGIGVDQNIYLAESYASLAGAVMGTDTIVRNNLSNSVSDITDALFVQWITDGHVGETVLTNFLTAYPGTAYAGSVYSTTEGILNYPTVWALQSSQECKWVRFGTGPVATSFDNGPFATSAFEYGTSTISAYGGPIGSQSAFQRIECDVTGSTQGSLSTSFRAIVTLANATGPILANKVIQNVPTMIGQWRRVRFDLPTLVTGGSQRLWFTLVGSNPFGVRMLAVNAYPTSGGYAQSQYQTSNSIDGTTWANNSSQFTPYMRLSTLDYSVYSSNGPDDVKYALQQIALSSTAPTLLVPSQLYAVAGGPEAWVQWDNVCTNGYGVGPAERFYSFATTFSKATQYTQGLQYEPATGDVGTYPVPITVWHGGTPWQTSTSTLNVVAPTNGSGTTRKVLIIGDSTTAAGYYQAQAKRLFDSGSGLTVTWLGTQTETVNASDGTAETVRNEGYSGQSCNWFYTNASSPFVSGGVFNFSGYMTANGYTMGSGDWVIINLKINDIFNYITDPLLQAAITTRLAAINGMVASIRAYNSGIRIGITSGTPPYRTQDGFGVVYGSTSTEPRNRYRRNWDLAEKSDLLYWDNANQVSNNIYYLPFGCNWDTANNQSTANTVTLTVSGATDASPIVIACSAPEGVVTGDSVTLSGVGGNTAANGTFTATVVDRYHFSLNGTIGNGTYTSGGTVSAPMHANMRNPTQITRDANSVHPATIGYYQLGDQLWADLLGLG